MSKPSTTVRKNKKEPSPYFFNGQTPTWEVAYLFPPKGMWTEEDFWALEGVYEGAPRVELANGYLDVLPMPTTLHQIVLFFLAKLLDAFAEAHAPGLVLPAGMQIRLKKNLVRDPDIVYMMEEHSGRVHKKFWDGADLVMEVVSPDPKDTKRDWEEKRRDYARARIPEYWIIDPQKQVIRVLTLKGKTYRVHGDFKPGETATSVLLKGFEVDVAEALAPPGSKLGK